MEIFSKSKDIFFSNFNKICRTCIKTITEPLHQIFDSEVVILNESIKTSELLIAVSTLKLHPDDDLPKAICIQCLDSLTKAYNFQKMCILSDLCMRSAILPNELQISLQKANPVHSSKQSDVISTIFEPCVQNLIASSENSINALYSEPVNRGIQNIGHSEESVVSKPIIQSNVLPIEDINAIKILLLPAGNDHHSGSSMIIPDEINSSMNIFPPVPPSIGHVDHLTPSMVIPSEINSNINSIPTEPLPNEAIPLEQRMQSNMVSNELKVDFTNVPMSEVPPWKRGLTFQSIETTIQELCVQSVIVSGENKRNNIFPTKALLRSNRDHLNVANVSEPCMDGTNISIEEKNCTEILSVKTSTVSDPIQHSNKADRPTKDYQSSIVESELESSFNNLLAIALSSEVEIGHSEEMTVLKIEPKSKFDDNNGDEKSNFPENFVADSSSTEYDINNSIAIQTKKISDYDDNDDNSNFLLADSHCTESNTDRSDVTNVKIIEPSSTETVDNLDNDDAKTKVLVDVEGLIQRTTVDNGVTNKEEPIKKTSGESKESNSESMDQTGIEEDVDNEMENPEPAVQQIEKPNPRTKKNVSFTCETCGKTFDSDYRLHRHMNLHKKEGRPFECEYCRRRFAQEPHLQRHFITHKKTFLDMIETKQNVDGYQCAKCPRKFLKQVSLASHMRTHRKEINGSKRIKCEICSKVFESVYGLTRHKKMHEGNRKYNCEICGKTFGLSSHLVDHLNMHSGIKPHVCEICQKSFQQACTLKDHLRTHTGEMPFLCAECGKTFNNSSNLRQHQLRHSGIKRYQCPECPSRFTCKSGLFSHSTTHRNQKPYVCGTCGSRFTKNYSLKKHERIHTGVRPYKCDHCEMRFNSSDHMKRHMRTHTGEKPYKCKYCERKFAQSNDMIKHLRSHVGENVYKCEECDASFRLNAELKRHISEHYQAQVKDKTIHIS